MAKLYIVNEKDEIIRETERETVSTDEIVRTTALWITNDKGDILLSQRSFSKKYNPGRWDPAAAGTVEAGESYESNIEKEAFEEIGIKNEQFELGPKRFFQKPYRCFCQFFSWQTDLPSEEFTIQADEINAIKWWKIEELKKAIKDNPDQFSDAVIVPIKNKPSE